MAGGRAVMIVLVILGILAFVAGVIYLAVPAHALPSFYPGHIAGSNAHHDKRAAAGIVGGVVLVLVGVFLGRMQGPQPAS
ncbi:MAG TPA: hypothetical protein VKY26_13350 [Actinomycetota bacterium]|nr:hypothetical protein [Actinomycetota bacterium]